MNKDKKFMIFGVILLLISLVGSLGTYAWFTWKSTNNTSLTMSIGKFADVIFTSGNNISTSTLSPVYNYTDGEVTTFSINNKDTTGTIVDYAVKFDIIQKSGSWYAYGDTKLGQGSSTVKNLLEDNPELLEEITLKLNENLYGVK